MGVDNRHRSEEHGRGPRRRPRPGVVVNCEQPAVTIAEMAGFITVRRFRWGTVPGSGHRVSCALAAAPFGPGWAS